MLPIDQMSEALIGSHILLIDDSQSFRRLTVAILHKIGVASVTVASSLAEGMQEMNYLCQDKYGPQEFDLVMMDINLPDGSGIEGCQFTSSHANSHNIPVVVISGTSYTATTNDAFKAGASDFLHKPLNPSVLKARLGTLLKLKTSQWCFEDTALSKAARDTHLDIDEASVGEHPASSFWSLAN